MHINLVYDPSVADAPPAFKTALDAAAHALDTLIVDPIRVNIEVGYGEIEGQPHATSVAAQTAAYSAGRRSDRRRQLLRQRGAAKAWRLLAAKGSEPDGGVGFSSVAGFDYDRPTARCRAPTTSSAWPNMS